MAAAPVESMVQMQGLVKTFRNAAGEFIVLKGLDLTIGRGEFVSIVGKSGSGKSTLLNMITGIDHPTGGRVVIGGMDIYAGVSESSRSRWRGRNLGIVFQFFQLLPMLTLLENVMLPMDYADRYEFDERPGRARELLQRVGLESLADTLPALVSTGQQQLAAIARALACDPPLLVADEPTGNLDSRSAGSIIDLFTDLSRSGKTIVMVTHDPSITARTTRNLILCDGELIDESVSRALPSLQHRQMLAITKQAGRATLQAGEVLVQPGQRLETVYIVVRGALEVLPDDARGRRLAPVGAGEILDGSGLARAGRATALIRAGAQPVEVLTFPRSELLRMMAETPATADHRRGGSGGGSL
jgi:putative ABC transport system ATP-binding protein